MEHEHTLEGHREQHVTALVDSTVATMTDADKQDRDLRAVEVAAISGFVETVGGVQASCLSLCNTCREHVPVERLRISAEVPASILEIVCPGSQPVVAGDSPRVFSHRRALNVHWNFVDCPPIGCFEPEEEQKELEVCETDLAAGGNVDISNVRWPADTREIALTFFSGRIDAVTWPPCLEILWFGDPCLETLWFGDPVAASSRDHSYRIHNVFNTPLDGTTFPGGLREMFLGESFNQPIEGVALPEGLERLSLPGFNKSIQNVQWPPGLKALEFVSPFGIMWKERYEVQEYLGSEEVHCLAQGCFNQPLGTTLPQSLESLWLPDEFSQPLDDVSWPGRISTLGFAFDVGAYHFVGSITWPSSLHDLVLFYIHDQDLSLPQGSKVTVLERFHHSN